MEDEKKRGMGTDEGFLKTAAEAVGTTLGKLAVRTGLAKPRVTVKRKKTASRPKTKAAAKKAPAARKSAGKRAVNNIAPLKKKSGK